MKLTELEQKTLDYIIDTITCNGYSPSVRDIKEALGYKSTSTVYNCLRKLEREGLISKEEGKSRTIRVENLSSWMISRTPVVGRVTSRLPVLTAENYEGYVNFIADSIGYNQINLFALKVGDDAMREAGILAGDVVVAECREYAENGEIVAASLGGKTVIRRFFRDKGRCFIRPDGIPYELEGSECPPLLGVVVACMRIY